MKLQFREIGPIHKVTVRCSEYTHVYGYTATQHARRSQGSNPPIVSKLAGFLHGVVAAPKAEWHMFINGDAKQTEAAAGNAKLKRHLLKVLCAYVPLVRLLLLEGDADGIEAPRTPCEGKMRAWRCRTKYM